MVERSLSMREVPGSIPGASKIFTVSSFEIKSQTTHNRWNRNHFPYTWNIINYEAKSLQRPGIEPGPPAWQASILPLNQRCCCLLCLWEWVQFPICSQRCKGHKNFETQKFKINASSGNRTRAARVAGEHSTTEPTMLYCQLQLWPSG